MAWQAKVRFRGNHISGAMKRFFNKKQTMA